MAGIEMLALIERREGCVPFDRSSSCAVLLEFCLEVCSLSAVLRSGPFTPFTIPSSRNRLEPTFGNWGVHVIGVRVVK